MFNLFIKRGKSSPESQTVLDPADLDEVLRQMNRKDEVSFDGGQTWYRKNAVKDPMINAFFQAGNITEVAPKTGTTPSPVAARITSPKAVSIEKTPEFGQVLATLENRVQEALLPAMKTLGEYLADSISQTASQLNAIQSELTTQADQTGQAHGQHQAIQEALRQIQTELNGRLSENLWQDLVTQQVRLSAHALETELAAQLTSLNEKISEFEQKQSLELKLLNEKQARLQDETDEIESLIDENQTMIARYKPGHVSFLEQKIERLEGEITTLDEKLREKTKALDQKERENLRLQSDSNFIDQDELDRKLESIREREQDLRSREALRHDYDTLKKKYDELEEMRSVYEANQSSVEHNKVYERECARLTADNKKISAELVNMCSQNDASRKSIQRLEERRAALLEAIKERDAKLEEQKRINEDLVVKLDALKAREDELIAREESSLAKLAELDRREKDIENERLGMLEKLHADSEEALKTRREQLELEFKERHDQLEEKLRSEIQRESEKHVKKLEEEVKNLTPFQQNFHQLAKEYHQQSEDRLAWELAHDKRQRDQKILEDDIAKRQEEITELNNKLENLDSFHTDIIRELKELEGQSAAVRGELSELQERRDRASKELKVDYQQRIEPIEVGIFERCDHRHEFDNQQTGEMDWLNNLNQKIKNAGFVFPQRLIHAFHTSLKIAEWAPLTVLSGVSGTGKSELPRLYSMFGGLHHQLISVQPNWDSPQDLLGFFNYMDNSYKATDLLRALVQSQQPREKGGFEDQLMLVLLDEMNLARVELYFSEFLSKLEARRGLAANDVPKIKVDVGSGQKEYEVKLGSNILFVGTMNEDETTQTLSDKVLDRGNVISFPRPSQLKRRDLRTTLEGTPDRLPLSTWNSWIVSPEKGLQPEVRTNIENAMNQVNDSLRLVQRAIGHRVLQAVENYVANHPQVRKEMLDGEKISENTWKLALEDQIAQKIMPKLRGIETDTENGRACLTQMSRVLDEFAPGLSVDFENAKTAGSGAFIWSSASYLEKK